ncbi:MAG TPA: class I SAM-dependent methyltransferase [Phycisphaerae bacterium]|nr:class I SAM-dependent methyltransferase [Phycisphaerae bacterium]HNU46701.1 class I SAM-dependent methyltransferase [Phycisphaerae bacterium]
MSIAGSLYYRACSTRWGLVLARQAARGLRGLGLLPRDFLPTRALELDRNALAGLLRLWPQVHWSCGDGMMPAEQLLAVYRLAVDWPVAGDVVELGSWVGLTTTYLATACHIRRSGHVYAVDTFAGTREGETTYASVGKYAGDTFPAFQARIARAGVSDYVTPLRGLTQDMVHHYPGGPVRVLLIDADHSYAGVRRDFELWSPLVAPGGLIIFHDYLMEGAGVRRFVDEDVARLDGYALTPGHVAPNVMAATKRAPVPAPPRDQRHMRGRVDGTPVLIGPC